MTLRFHPDEVVAKSSSPLLKVAPWWERIRLGDIAEVVNGGAFKSDLFNKRRRGEPLVRIRDVGRNSTQVHYDGPYDKRHVIDHGDLLVGMDGDFRVAAWAGSRALLNQRVCRLRVIDPDVYSNRFLLHVLQPYLDAVHTLTSSVTVKHLSSRTIEDLPIPLPPRGAGADRRRHRRTSLSPRRRSSFSIAGGSPPCVPPFPHRRASDRSSDFPGLDDDYPTVPLPSDWTWARASAACEMVSSGSTPKAAELFSGFGEIPFIKVYNLRFEGRLDFTIRPTFVDRRTHERQLRRSRLFPGDILVNIVGPPLGKVSMVPDDYPEWNMNQAVAAFRPRPSLRPEFLAYLLTAHSIVEPLLRTGKATAGQINLNISACRRLWLPVPPIAVQKTLVRRLDASTSSWEDALNQVGAASARGHNLRRSILAAAFSGQLVRQDPDEGPASLLLDHILAERVAAMPKKRHRKVRTS